MDNQQPRPKTIDHITPRHSVVRQSATESTSFQRDGRGVCESFGTIAHEGGTIKVRVYRLGGRDDGR